MFWKIAIPTAVVLAALTAFSAGEDKAPPDKQPAVTTTAPQPKSTTTTKPRPGSPTVYAEIAAETDCGSLQESFDRAEATSKRPGGTQNLGTWRQIGIGYMEAADARMKAVGCY